jgi:hypothetical protein
MILKQEERKKEKTIMQGKAETNALNIIFS